jgi:hypothetical protein
LARNARYFHLKCGKKVFDILYKKKKSYTPDISMTSDSEVPSLEDFKNISKMINQDDQTTVQKNNLTKLWLIKRKNFSSQES